MISRVADHCLWLGRYVERAESTARVLFVTQNLSLDGELTPRQVWHPVLIVSGEEPRFVERFGDAAAGDAETVQDDLTWNEENPVSILRSVAAARDNARSIREVVSLEAWEVLNELHLWLRSDAARAEYRDQRYTFYRHIRQQCQLWLGLVRSTMLHDTPLDFIWLGMLLERAGQTSRMLDVHHHALSFAQADDPIIATALWLSLLRACSGSEPFMKKNVGKVTGSSVAAFLILERAFPRSLRYCIHAAYERLATIRPPSETTLPGARALERLRALDEWLSQKSADALDQGQVHGLLTHVVDEVTAVGVLIGEELFGYGPAAPESPDAPAAPQ